MNYGRGPVTVVITQVFATREDEWFRIEPLNDECVVWTFGVGEAATGHSIRRLDQFGAQLRKAIQDGWVLQDE